MKRLGQQALVLLVCGILAACTGMGGGGDGTVVGSDGEMLPMVKYEYVYAMATFSQEVTISKDGQIDVNQVNGPGPKDRIRVHGQITPEQKAELQKAMKGWNNYKPYYSAFFGPVMSITYQGRKVEAGDNESAPASLRNARQVLDKLVTSVIAANRPSEGAGPQTPAARTTLTP